MSKVISYRCYQVIHLWSDSDGFLLTVKALCKRHPQISSMISRNFQKNAKFIMDVIRKNAGLCRKFNN